VPALEGEYWGVKKSDTAEVACHEQVARQKLRATNKLHGASCVPRTVRGTPKNSDTAEVACHEQVAWRKLRATNKSRGGSCLPRTSDVAEVFVARNFRQTLRERCVAQVACEGCVAEAAYNNRS